MSGEYAVLDGALALALPCKLGQRLEVTPAMDGHSHWTALDRNGSPWLEVSFDLSSGKLLKTTHRESAEKLMTILTACMDTGNRNMASQSFQFTTRLEFDRDWGLGSSSTLLSLLAQWAEADPFALMRASFGGSGYDLACAVARGPVLYRINEGQPAWLEVPLQPSFADQIYFVYLGQKQNSREGIARYRAKVREEKRWISRVDRLTWRMATAQGLEVWADTMDEHENLIARMLDLPKAKDLYFEDYWGSVKSLGAWGGDFVMATSSRSAAATRAYFERAGYSDIFPMSQFGLMP